MLDPHLPQITSFLITRVSKFLEETEGKIEEPKNITLVFIILYTLTKVRGYKTIIKLFPHEVVDLVRTFRFLELKMASETSPWEVSYILFLWMKIIILIPFNLDSLDDGDVPLRQRLLDIGKRGISDSRIVNRAASEFLSTLLTRPDFTEDMNKYLEWAREVLTKPITNSRDIYFINEVVFSLCKILVLGERSKMVGFSLSLIEQGIHEKVPANANRKLTTKLFQRIGLVLLPPKTPKWKYSRKKQSLEFNLKGTTSTVLSTNIEEEDAEYDVPEEIEVIIGMLIDSLKDKQTMVRWSAAKGLARITNRLPLELANEITSSLFELFSPLETDTTLHGVCLATAEFIRRGLILPERIDELIPKVLVALVFEQRRGNFLTGSHVRDAACYVCWSLARTYEPAVLSPQMKISLACSLLITSLFDREVNCRRAAAAAFQEHVGRQGEFPYGIDIIGKVNFFTLANRSICYTEISVNVAQYEEYRMSLIEHLWNVKYSHSDISIREITAQALYNMVPLNPSHFIDKVIPFLIQKTNDRDVGIHHGSLLSLTSIIKSLKQIEYQIPNEIKAQLREIPMAIDKLGLHKGKYGHLVRIAICRLIEALSTLKISLAGAVSPDSKKSFKTLYMSFLEENLKHSLEEVSQVAASCFNTFLKVYFPTVTETLIEKITLRWIRSIEKETVYAKRGYYLGLGSLPKVLIGDHFNTLVESFVNGMDINKNEDVESRKNSILGVTAFISHNGFSEDGINRDNARSIFNSIVNSLDDYTTDSRGDIGSLIRETALDAFNSLLKYLGDEMSDWIKNETLLAFLQKTMKQLFEKIDRTREVAGKSLVLFSKAHHFMKDNFSTLFDIIGSNDINFGSSQEVFSTFIQFLDNDTLRGNMLQGLVRSVGGRNNNKELVEDSVKYLTEYLQNASPQNIENISKDIIIIMDQCSGNDQDVISVCKTIEAMLSTGCFAILNPSSSPFTGELIRIINKELKKATLTKLFAIASLASLLLSFENPARSNALGIMIKFLGSKYPALRKLTADHLYLQLECNTDIFKDDSAGEEIKDILITTSWEDESTESFHKLIKLSKEAF